MRSALILTALTAAASASPFRSHKKAHYNTDSYDGKHCDTSNFLYACSDVDSAQLYACGPVGYQACTWKKDASVHWWDHLQGERILCWLRERRGRLWIRIQAASHHDRGQFHNHRGSQILPAHNHRRIRISTHNSGLLSSITQQPTTTPSDHYEDNDDKAPCTNSDEYRCSDVDVQQCGYVAGPKLVWLTLDTCNAGTCGPLANVGCPQEKAK